MIVLIIGLIVLKKGIPIFISHGIPWIPKGAHQNALKERLLPEILSNKLSLISDDDIYKSFPGLNDFIENYTSKVKTNDLIVKKKSSYPDVKLFETYNNESKFKKSFEENFGRPPTPKDLGHYNYKKVFELVDEHSSELNILDTTNVIWVRPDLEIISLNYEFLTDNSILTQSIKFGDTCGDYILQFKYENKEFFTDLFNYHANNPLGDAYRKESGPKLFGGSARFFGNYVDLLDVSYVFLRTLKLPLDEICNIISSQPRESIPNDLLEFYEEALLHSNK